MTANESVRNEIKHIHEGVTMFEKEAEEYKDTYFGFADERISEVQDFEGNYIDISERIMKTFIDGAEFGYNKANEWHYPSKGEYPIDKTEMLVYFKYADYEYPCKTFGFYNGHFWDTKRGDVSNKEVIAWKKIVLPELPKEN